MKRTTLAATVLALMASPLVAGSNDLVPLETVVAQLKNETDKNHGIRAIASRCMANRAWLQIRQTNSFEISGKVEEKQMAERMQRLTYGWFDIAKEIGEALDPIATSDEVQKAVLDLHAIQVEAYNESAWKQKALTGHFIPKTWVEDGLICKTFEEQMDQFAN